MRSTSHFSLLLLALLLAVGTTTANAQRLFKWTDEHGVVHYGTSIPPEYKDRAHQRLNSQGVVVDETERAKTEEELHEQMRLATEEAAKQAALEEERRNRQLLLTTYAAESDILDTRDQRCEVIDRAIDASRAYISGRTRHLQRVLDRAAQLESRGHNVSDALRSSIEEIRRQINDQESFIADKAIEREEVVEYYDAELVRYRDAVESRQQRRAQTRGS